MKTKLIITISILLNLITINYSQEMIAPHEIFIYTESGVNPPPNSFVKFALEAESAVWDQDFEISTQTTQNLISTLNFAHAYNFYNQNDDAIPIPYYSQASIWGIRHVLSFLYGIYLDNRTFGYGKYRAFFTWYDYEDYLIEFYLDYTDCDFTDYYNGNDIWIKFNATDFSVKIDWDDGDFEDNVTNVNSGVTYNIWLEKNKSLRDNQQNTSYFELYLYLTSVSRHPHLVWNPYHSTNILGYNLYRKITTSSGSQTDVEFIADTCFTDYEFTIDPKKGNDFVEYWIKAIITSTQESLESNHRSTAGISEIQWKKNYIGQNNIVEFELGQNYPNPFNPTTTISYQLPAEGLVSLKVYDILGSEVATLVNEEKPAGRYEVKFDASRLSSGVYFYRIQAGSFTDTKKIILLR